MLLVSPDDVLVRASMSRTVSGLNDVVASVIEGAGGMVEAMLSASPLHRQITDYFNHVELNRFGALHLSQQFARTSPIKIYTADSQIFPPDKGEQSSSTSFHFGEGSATILLPPLAFPRYTRFVVEYEAGFAQDSGGVAIGVPDWLREAVISAALYVLQAQVITHQKSIEQRDYTNILRKHLYALVAPRIRPSMGMNYPDATITATITSDVA